MLTFGATTVNTNPLQITVIGVVIAVVFLASIVGVRTVLSYFLRMELKQGVG